MTSKALKSSTTSTLRFEDGAVQFRQRLVLSILSCRPLLLKNLRSNVVDDPGLRPYEVSFLRLLHNMTNGSRIEINNTGTQLRFHPGVLVGGEIQHDCPPQSEQQENEQEPSRDSIRSIGWFLEGILPLAPFGKEPLSITFTGITDGLCHQDPSADYLKASALPLMKLFGIGVINDQNDIFDSQQQVPMIKIVRRGAAPAGGGCVQFYCPIVPKELKAIDYTDEGKVKRVRGTAVTCKLVSSSMAARTAYSCKGLLHRLLPDVWIHTDVHSAKQHKCGPSPSLSLILTAESTSGVILSAECCLDYNNNNNSVKKELPEDFGTRGAAMLLEEVRRGGCIDSGLQSLALIWMALTPEDVSRLRLGTLTEYTIVTLRLLKMALGVEFKVTADVQSKTVLLSCLGSGYRNMARAST